MSHITTHSLDAPRGRPGADGGSGGGAGTGETVAGGRRSRDGRVGGRGPERLEPGHYRLRFEVAEYFAASGTPTFYPVVTIDFHVADAEQHYHVPLLISPFAYSTYRGS